MSQTDYDALAGAYSRGRKPFPSVMGALIEHGNVTSQSKVLEVGCGTGNHISALVRQTGCQGWGVEPSSGMLSHTHPDLNIQFLQGPAEQLPLEPGQFDLVFSVDVIHHVQGKPGYFTEAFRTLKPDGWLCTVTETHEMIKQRKPQSDYFYASALADCERYPDFNDLKLMMTDTGFLDINTQSLTDHYEVTDAASYEEKAYSSLLLISEEDFRSGLERMKRDLALHPLEGCSHRLCLWGKIRNN